MKQIETGCLAIIIGATVPSNNGKVVKVGRYIGDAPEFDIEYRKDHWMIDTDITTSNGVKYRQAPECVLLRIDGDPELDDEEVADLELMK